MSLFNSNYEPSNTERTYYVCIGYYKEGLLHEVALEFLSNTELSEAQIENKVKHHSIYGMYEPEIIEWYEV